MKQVVWCDKYYVCINIYIYICVKHYHIKQLCVWWNDQLNSFFNRISIRKIIYLFDAIWNGNDFNDIELNYSGVIDE